MLFQIISYTFLENFFLDLVDYSSVYRDNPSTGHSSAKASPTYLDSASILENEKAATSTTMN